MTIRVWRTLSIVAALCMAIVQTPGAVAEGPDATGAFEEQIEAVARSQGISFEEALDRHNLRQAMEPAIEFIRDRPTDFGRLSLDDSGGQWRLHIYVVGDNVHRDTIEALLPPSAPFEWTSVRYSWAQLEDTRMAVRVLANDLGRLAFNYIRTDVRQNRVIASLRLGESELASSLRATYEPDLLEVVLEEPTGRPVACTSTGDPDGGSRYNCTPFRGGIELQTIKNSHSQRCTMTLWAKQPNGIKHIITAGHCPGKTWHNGILVVDCSQWGSVCKNTIDIYQSGGSPNSDARRMPNDSQSSNFNKIYHSELSKAHPMTSKIGWNGQETGDPVCKTGVGTEYATVFGLTCGTVFGNDTISRWLSLLHRREVLGRSLGRRWR